MVITLPDQLKSLQGLTETEVLEDLAVSFYAARRVTLVQAADLARKSLFEFQALLRDRRIPLHYDEADLEQDLAVLRELSPK
jgi:predicted HTH domain antitoxin